MDLGKAGDSNTMVKLFCELMPHGWKLIREGWREGLPKDKPPKWTFCPLKKFPRDRVLVEECKNCRHFKGLSHSLERGKQGQTKQQPQGTKYGKLNIKKGKPQSKRPRITLTEKDLEKAVKEKEEEDRKFWEEEKRLQKKIKESEK